MKKLLLIPILFLLISADIQTSRKGTCVRIVDQDNNTASNIEIRIYSVPCSEDTLVFSGKTDKWGHVKATLPTGEYIVVTEPFTLTDEPYVKFKVVE